MNNRKIRYVLTVKGLDDINHRTWGYFKRTIKNVVYYKEAIEKLILDNKNKRCEGLILKGSSNLDFILEYVCGKADLIYIKKDSVSGKIFLLYSEIYLPAGEEPEADSAFLESVFI